APHDLAIWRAFANEPCVDHEYPIREQEHFVQIAGENDDRGARSSGVSQSGVDIIGGAYVQAPRRILDHEQRRRIDELARQDELLLIPTGERACWTRRRPATYIEARDQ